MLRDIEQKNPLTELTKLEVGKLANEAAARSALADYQSRKSDNTLRRQKAALRLFQRFLTTLSLDLDLSALPSWENVTWGLVAAFQKWMLLKGYSIGTINVRLSTVKVYAKLATKAGHMDIGEFSLIQAVQGYGHQEGIRLDDKRLLKRQGFKKARPLPINENLAAELKAQPDSPQGKRDAVIICLLLDHGLRVGELALLKTKDIDLKNNTLTFYRPKVSKHQTHKLSQDSIQSLGNYLELAENNLLLGSRKDGSLHGGMSIRAITKRVKDLGERVGLHGLSAHDLRHYWATQAARKGTPIEVLMEAGGWSSLAMPARYIEATRIANDGVIL